MLYVKMISCLEMTEGIKTSPNLIYILIFLAILAGPYPPIFYVFKIKRFLQCQVSIRPKSLGGIKYRIYGAFHISYSPRYITQQNSKASLYNMENRK